MSQVRLLAAALCAVLGLAQSDRSPTRPLRTQPAERLTVNPGFRDWGPTTIAGQTAGYYLFALDAKTAQERWRYRAEAPYVHSGVCLRQPIVTSDTVFAAGEFRLFAVSGGRWKGRSAPSKYTVWSMRTRC